MAKLGGSTGEALERRQTLRKRAVYAALFLTGLSAGIYIGTQIVTDGLDLAAPWPPAGSLILLALYLGAVIFGGMVLGRHTDEVEKQAQYKATAFAGLIYMLLYPAWFILWKGGFVHEPIHWVPFLAFWLALAGGSIYYRYR